MVPDSNTMARDISQRHGRAIHYLDTCGAFTYDKYVKAHQLGGVATPDAQIRMLWNMAEQTFLPSLDGRVPGGVEGLRCIMREKLTEGLAMFEGAAVVLEPPSPKKWWQFWKG